MAASTAASVSRRREWSAIRAPTSNRRTVTIVKIPRQRSLSSASSRTAMWCWGTAVMAPISHRPLVPLHPYIPTISYRLRPTALPPLRLRPDRTMLIWVFRTLPTSILKVISYLFVIFLIIIFSNICVSFRFSHKEVTSAVPADNPRISTLFLPKASKFKIYDDRSDGTLLNLCNISI